MEKARQSPAPLKFLKLEGAGNDFILIDGDDETIPSDIVRFARHACAFHLGIGADGVVIYNTMAPGSYRMAVFNPDGTNATMCGNAVRCCALHLMTKHHLSNIVLEMADTLHECVLRGGEVATAFCEPRAYAGPLNIGSRVAFTLNTGTAHAVMFVSDVESEDVEQEGKVVRWHKCFEPFGTNVNFVEIKDGRTIKVRTYERYLERETLSCGTGAVASALVARHLGKIADNRVVILNRTSEPLVVTFSGTTLPFRDIWLSGPARPVYRGEIIWLDAS